MKLTAIAPFATTGNTTSVCKWEGASNFRKTWQVDGLAQAHDAGGPAVVQQISDTEVGNLLDEFGVVGFRIDVFVVTKLGVDAQVGTAADGGGEIDRAAGGGLAFGVERERGLPVVFRCGGHWISFKGHASGSSEDHQISSVVQSAMV